MIDVASWFKGKRDSGERRESTVQVEARVIAEAMQPPPPVEIPGIAPEVVEQLAGERRSLVALCLYAHDRARSSGVAERIEEGLSAVGVVALRPDGDRFDPAVHEAGGTLDTEDEALAGTVAETEVVGFSDRGQVLRAPIVTVYTAPTAKVVT